MNKQRKVLITITYNEMGIIVETKAEEVAQPNLQPTCNQLATDCISRQMAIDAIERNAYRHTYIEQIIDIIKQLPSADVVKVVRCKDCKWFNLLGCAIDINDDSDKPTEDDYCSFGERRTDEIN